MTERKVSSERVSEERLAETALVWHYNSPAFFAVAVLPDGQRIPVDSLREQSRVETAYKSALRSSVKTVGVKKLEWRVLTEGFSLQRAETTLGDYRIWREVSGAWFWSLYDGKYSGGSEDKEDQAKAAAQADYERRVLSAIEAPAASSEVTEPDPEQEAYEIGKRDGYDEAVQDIDRLTGGDGEYRYVMGAGYDDERHTPDAETMKLRIIDRFAAISALGNDIEDGDPCAWLIQFSDGSYDLQFTFEDASARMAEANDPSALRRPLYATAAPSEVTHPDDIAVDRFAAAMKAKLAKKQEEGRGGWERKDECSADFLSDMLREHVVKGDPVDVANFAMMLHQRGERIAAASSEVTEEMRKEALRLLQERDERDDRVQDMIEDLREIVLLMPAADRPEGLMKQANAATYAMRGRTRLMDDAALTAALKGDRP